MLLSRTPVAPALDLADESWILTDNPLYEPEKAGKTWFADRNRKLWMQNFLQNEEFKASSCKINAICSRVGHGRVG